MCNCDTYPGGNVCIEEILDNFKVYTDAIYNAIYVIKDKLVNFLKHATKVQFLD